MIATATLLLALVTLLVSAPVSPPVANPLASTGEVLFPFPSRFFQVPDPSTETGVRNAFPKRAVLTSGAVPAVDFSLFNFGDGHSPTAPLLVHFGVDVHERFLIRQHEPQRSLERGAPIALFDMDSGERVPVMTENDANLRTDANAGRHPLIVRPLMPMRLGARHVCVLTRDLTTVDGDPLETPPGFAALRDREASQDLALEAARPAYEEIFRFLTKRGYPRDRQLLAWDFVVASRRSVLGPILSMRDQALDETEGKGLGYTIDEVEVAPNENTGLLVKGTFEVPSFLDDEHRITRRPDGGAERSEETQWFPFTMVVPPNIKPREKLSLVLFGHGIFGSGRRYLAGKIGRRSIQPLSNRGRAVVVATDFIGLCRADRTLLLTELIGDLNRVHVITDRLQQSLINNLVLVELVIGDLQKDRRLGQKGRRFIDPDRVNYYGVSLGGIQGASVVSLSRRIRHACLAVPGGAWATLLTRSIVFKPFKDLVDRIYPDPLLQQTFIAMFQSRFDGSDGANLGRLLYREPLADAPTGRRVLLQEAIADCQVPNIATRILARVIGADLLSPAVEDVFGLDLVEGPTTRPALVQILLEDQVDAYTPPDQNVLPDRDNGTHSDAVRLPVAFEQMLKLFEEGVIESSRR